MANMLLKVLEIVQPLGILEIIPPFDFNSNKLSGVAAGEDNADAVNRGQVKADTIEINIDGENAVLSQNAFGIAKVPFNCTITKATLISRESGATVAVDLLAGATMAAVASITGTGTKPGLTAAQEASVTDFTNWGSTSLTKGQILQAKVTTASPVAVKHAYIMIEVERA